MSDLKVELPKLDKEENYEAWRFQMFSVLSSFIGLKEVVEQQLAWKEGDPEITISDQQKKDLGKLFGSAVAKISGSPLVHAQQSGKTTLFEILRYLDSVYRSDTKVARQIILKSVIGDRFDPAKESLEAFFGRKHAQIHQRLKKVTKDDLLILGVTTT